MNTPSIKLLVAASVTVAYLVAAIAMVHSDRTAVGGGFITLRGMGAWIVTLPVSLPCELLGSKLDYRSNVQMGAAIATCAGLVFGLVFGLAKLGQMVWSANAHR